MKAGSLNRYEKTEPGLQSREKCRSTDPEDAKRRDAARADMWRIRKASLADRERSVRSGSVFPDVSSAGREETAGREPWSIPTDPEIEALYRKYEVPDRVQRHMKMAAYAAERIVSDVSAAGIFYDTELIRAAALLHDIARTQKNHPEAGAKILAEEGYELIGMLVREHHSPDRVIRYPDKVSEEDLLYYADKIVLEDRIVSLKERFEKSMSRIDSEEGMKNLQKRWDKASEIEKELQNYSAVEKRKAK